MKRIKWITWVGGTFYWKLEKIGYVYYWGWWCIATN